ncbi:hypothetical protein GCM10011579_094510 [Streptomyces albiflavescens]|uniref:Uncharacterized protein n=1 Tax=Streptomyces albiflavescens TaxID=1623582 RepID=A0A917YFF7_9ACTN|nr:hypothetical protein GCM10011579_094510 [Streptomyces albiflavescens]
MPDQPYVIDPAGADLHGEADRLRELPRSLNGTGGAPIAVAPIELPGGIRAWAPTQYEVLKQLLADDRVSKDPNQHWPAWIDGKYRDSWINL